MNMLGRLFCPFQVWRDRMRCLQETNLWLGTQKIEMSSSPAQNSFFYLHTCLTFSWSCQIWLILRFDSADVWEGSHWICWRILASSLNWMVACLVWAQKNLFRIWISHKSLLKSIWGKTLFFFINLSRFQKDWKQWRSNDRGTVFYSGSCVVVLEGCVWTPCDSPLQLLLNARLILSVRTR